MKQESIAFASWPEFDPAKVQKNVVTVVGQVNGKVRAKIEVETDIPDEETERA